MPKRPFLAALIAAAAIVLVLSFKTPEAAPLGAAAFQVVGSPDPAGASTAPNSGASGTYTGSTVQMPFGPVQVQITVQSGRITGVQALQQPSGDPHSSQISAYAVPRLIQETLNAQSARINAISGATYTSWAFAQSLQSALTQAGI
jgi:uncharacterized protein with FMN-binding domain